VDDEGRKREPAGYQVVTLRDGRITHIQDYRKRRPALRDARARVS
jgi:hypothetical protein